MRSLGGVDLPLVAVVGFLLFYLLFIPADFDFFPSKAKNLPAPAPIAPQNIVKSCPICPAPIKCPDPAPIPDAGENIFCRARVATGCNHVRLPDYSLCRLLSDVLSSNYTGDVCSEGSPSIPHILHQSWKQAEGLPPDFSTWSQSWKDLQPDWEYRFWSDLDNDNLVTNEFSWFKDTYSKLPEPINRADIVRYLYMYKDGGVYADMDTWLMRRLDTLTEGFTDCVGQKAVVAKMSYDLGHEHNVPNAWMASSPGHPFWLFLVRVIQERYTEILMKQARGDDTYDMGVEKITGPVVLKEAYDTWQCMFSEELGRVELLEPGSVFVSNWLVEEQSSFFSKVCNETKITTEKQQKRCLRAYPYAHVLTFWTHTWTDEWSDKQKELEAKEKESQEVAKEAGNEEPGKKSKEEKDYTYEDEGDYH